MSLQKRLTLFFIVIVILPLAVAGLVVRGVVVENATRRSEEALLPTVNATVGVYNERSMTLDALVRSIVDSPSFGRALEEQDANRIEDFFRNQLNPQGLDFLIALDAQGRVVADAVDGPLVEADFNTPGPQQIAHSTTAVERGFARTKPIELRVGGRTVGSVVGGFWLDGELLDSVRAAAANVAIVVGDKVIASTFNFDGPQRIEIPAQSPFEASIDGAARASHQELGDQGTNIVAWTSLGDIDAADDRVLVVMAVVLLLALIVTAVVAYLLARAIIQPLEELTAGAQAIAEGRFDHHIPVRSRDEISQLADVFNDMSDRLSYTITQLYSSRSQLQRAVRRVGETLRSTHDLRQILESILHTSVDAVNADAAVMWRFSPTRDEVYPQIASELDVEKLRRLQVGVGIAGLVAERGVRVLKASGDEGPRAAAGEPNFPGVIAIPLYSQDRIQGVLSLYRRDASTPFSREDLETVVFLAEQGGVAIENVMLHEEAQRLSLMDGLTGVWNRRFFQMQFRQMLATALRFERPFSVLMLDLDHFKDVNDTYGHQRGDAILVEFAQRVSRTLREVDTFARYGGEEFICLLYETDIGGAIRAAEKILDTIRRETFGGVGEEAIRLTVSIGIASFPKHGDSFASLVEAADQALYRAKENGRDRLEIADASAAGLRVAK